MVGKMDMPPRIVLKQYLNNAGENFMAKKFHIIANFKKYKYLLSQLVIKEIKLKYRRSYLGIVWTLIEPLLTMIVLTIVFSAFLGRDGIADGLPFPVYILAGRLLYAFFSGSTKGAMKSVRTSARMIKKVYIPKYMYPLSSILANFLTFLISLIVLVGVAIVMKVQPTWWMLGTIIPIIQLLIMCVGMGLLLATISVFFRDFEYLWGVALMLIMYTCAIFYETSRLGESAWILEMNPIYAVIKNFRNCICGVGFDAPSMIYATVFGVVSLILGVVLFYKKQDDFILHL